MNRWATAIQTVEQQDREEKTRLVFNRDFVARLKDNGLLRFSDFFHLAGGELVKRLPDRLVTKFSLPSGEVFFLKRHFLELTPTWRLLPGRDARSQGAIEFDHYCLFRQRGLATAVPVAMGEREIVGGGIESFLLTEDFLPLVSLETMIRISPERFAGQTNGPWRRRVLLAAADYARRMHQAGLNHLDFNATHILLDEGGDWQSLPQVAVFDLQRVASGRLTAWRWPIKAMAELNFTLPRELLSEADRRLLLASYLGKDALMPSDRHLWWAIVTKTERIRRHTLKRWARRRAQVPKALAGPQHLLIHHAASGQVEPVSLSRLLRQVPGSRYVWSGEWRAKPVVVKAFQSGRRGVGQLAREWQGLWALRRRGIVAPLPLFFGEDGLGRQVLVVEGIEQAEAANTIPALQRPGGEGRGLREALMWALARQHSLGVEQRDLHLGNFLFRGGEIVTLDPAEMRFSQGALSWRATFGQLVAMGALFPALDDEEFLSLLLVYAKARGWHLAESTLSQLARARQGRIAANQAKRLKKYRRQNSRHREIASPHYRLLLDLQAGLDCPPPEELAAVLREACLRHPNWPVGQAIPFVWRAQTLAVYRLDEGPLCKRLLFALFPKWSAAQGLWAELYRQQGGPTPVALLLPRSPWRGDSFVVVR